MTGPAAAGRPTTSAGWARALELAERRPRADLAQPHGGRRGGARGPRRWARASTPRAGGAHAEAVALADGGRRGRAAPPSTSPSSPAITTGRTPPCVAAVLIAAGVGACRGAVRDPEPAGAGRGRGRALRAAGIEVTLGMPRRRGERLNRVFLTAMPGCGRTSPSSAAMTLDGKIAAADGSVALDHRRGRRGARRTGSAASADAVVVGIGTALADDPGARRAAASRPWPREPFRVVVDSRARLPRTARLIGAGSAGAGARRRHGRRPRRAGRRPRGPGRHRARAARARVGTSTCVDLCRAPPRPRRHRRPPRGRRRAQRGLPRRRSRGPRRRSSWRRCSWAAPPRPRRSAARARASADAVPLTRVERTRGG